MTSIERTTYPRFRRAPTVRELREIYTQTLSDVAVPGQSYWPQNRPFDANLALCIACNTSLSGKSTTHKTLKVPAVRASRRRASKGASHERLR